MNAHLSKLYRSVRHARKLSLNSWLNHFQIEHVMSRSDKVIVGFVLIVSLAVITVASVLLGSIATKFTGTIGSWALGAMAFCAGLYLFCWLLSRLLVAHCVDLDHSSWQSPVETTAEQLMHFAETWVLGTAAVLGVGIMASLFLA